MDNPVRAYGEALANPEFLILVSVMALFCSIISNLLVNVAAGKISVTQIATLGALTTLASMVSGILILGEPCSLAFITGAVLILFGIWQVTRPEP